MSWYYADGQDQKGPLEEADFQKLVANGTVKGDTLVWQDGMANWTAYSQIAGGAAGAAGGGIVCAECGGQFNLDQVVRFGDAYVCGTCKPTFVQRMQEGGVVAGAMNYAGFWIRFGAHVIDQLLLGVVNLVTNFVIPMVLGKPETQEQAMAVALGAAAANMAVYFIYETFFIGKFGATPGKMACKLKVVRPDGEKLTYLRAFGRIWGKMLSSMICLIGYIMAATDKEEHKALHDRICDTRVIRAE